MPTLDWIGKRAVLNHHRQVPYHLLRCDPKLSAGDPESGNLLVQGDNLLALKALLPYYAGQVKCIYIDPPYNTGNEGWVYNDAVNSPEMRHWLGKAVGKEAEDLSRHDKWLCMMRPRLALLHDFLREDGAIFVSIDDNEIANLRTLMDEIFGPQNFLAHLPTIMNLKGNQDQFGFAGTHEHTLVYSSSKERCRLFSFELDDEALTEWSQDKISLFKKGAPLRATGEESRREDRKQMFFPILVRRSDESVTTIPDSEYRRLYNPDADRFNDDFLAELSQAYEARGYDFVLPKNPDGSFGRWRWGWKPETWRKLGTDVIVIRSGGRIGLYKKQRPELGDLPSSKPKTVFYQPEYSSGNGTAELQDILGEKAFSNPKPLALISDFLRVGADKDSLILDSFAGSGTTGHAVLALNNADGGHRRFITIEMDPAIAQDITAQRLRRVSEGYTTPKGEKVEGLGSGFRYCTLAEPLFNEAGNIRDTVAFPDLANHVFFTETGSPLPKRATGKTPLLGTHAGKAVYLLFNGILGDKRPGGGNILTADLARALPAHSGPKIVYAEGCRLSPVRLKRDDIAFKQLPYQIRTT